MRRSRRAGCREGEEPDQTMKNLYILASFAAFVCCGMLSIDGFLGQLSQIMAGTGYAVLALVCAAAFAKAVMAKDKENEDQDHR